MAEVLKDVNTKKAKQKNDIPIKLIKENRELLFFVLSRIFTFNIYLPLKQLGITPIHKKDATNEKSNYRPVCILTSLSKPFKTCLYDQFYVYTDNILSRTQCRFGKGYSTQYSIIAMIEKWRRNMDQCGICKALFTDSSKAFDCLVHDFFNS